MIMRVNWYDSHVGFSSKDEIIGSTEPIGVSEKLSTPYLYESITSDDLQSQYSVQFSSKTENYCVGLVDMVDSTKISARIGWARSTRYYQLFLNSMSEILKRFGGFVIKNVGDCLVYYFPESSKRDRKFGFMSCIECSLAMIESHNYFTQILSEEGLPPVDYRISVDYGSVVIMKSNGTSVPDMIGPPVNMCSKINHYATRNGIVIGGDMYEMVKDFDDYTFKEVQSLSLGFKYSYPVYSVTRKKKGGTL